MKKILYLMHVDWLWIRQRPHFIAEGLSDDNFVIVLYRPHLKKFRIVKNKNFLAVPMFPIPKINFILELVDSCINAVLVKFICIIFKPNFAYLTSPAMFTYLKHSDLKTVYDCMDDLVEFAQSEQKREKIKKSECEVISKSDIIIFSSEHLSKVVMKRYNINFKYSIIRNGISDSIKVSRDAAQESPLMRYVYFGTIAEWFDFSSVIFALEALEDLEFVLYGPATVRIPDHPRLIYMGQRNHADLMEEVKNSYGYIMPFIINDLVLSVDPVKIYEYIALGKRVIASGYPEISHFGSLIKRYSDSNNLVEILLSIKELDDNYRDREEFISHSSWKSRVYDIERVINEL